MNILFVSLIQNASVRLHWPITFSAGCLWLFPHRNKKPGDWINSKRSIDTCSFARVCLGLEATQSTDCPAWHLLDEKQVRVLPVAVAASGTSHSKRHFFLFWLLHFSLFPPSPPYSPFIACGYINLNLPSFSVLSFNSIISFLYLFSDTFPRLSCINTYQM